MALLHIEHCLNARTHVWLFGHKILSWGPRRVGPYKNPKLGISYSVWDGEELLEQSIKQIRETADYINVVWQKLSWYGKPCNENLEETLLRLKDAGLIDELIFFEPDLSINPSYNEINKRNVGLYAARRAGCTHFMTMDTDEFYDPKQFRDAWTDIINRNLSHTCCNIVSYVTPTVRCRDYEDFFVSFINKIDGREKFTFDAFLNFCPCLVDPTRKIKLHKNSRFCFLGNIVMHHMTHVRKDINKKVANSTISQNKQSAKELKEKFDSVRHNIPDKIKSGEYIMVKNKFDIEI